MSNSTLQSKIQTMASDFANTIMEIVLSSPLEEIVGVKSGKSGSKATAALTPAETSKAPKKGKKGRLARRSEEDIAKVVASIVGLVNSKPNGLRAEQIKEKLGLEAKELPRPLADALASKQISKSGNKRATTYFGSKRAAQPVKKTKAVKAKAKAKKTTAKTAPKKSAAVKSKAVTKAKSAKKAKIETVTDT